MTTTQDEPAVAEQELPEDFTSAWASVLLDLLQKRFGYCLTGDTSQ